MCGFMCKTHKTTNIQLNGQAIISLPKKGQDKFTHKCGNHDLFLSIHTVVRMNLFYKPKL